MFFSAASSAFGAACPCGNWDDCSRVDVDDDQPQTWSFHKPGVPLAAIESSYQAGFLTGFVTSDIFIDKQFICQAHDGGAAVLFEAGLDPAQAYNATYRAGLLAALMEQARELPLVDGFSFTTGSPHLNASAQGAAVSDLLANITATLHAVADLSDLVFAFRGLPAAPAAQGSYPWAQILSHVSWGVVDPLRANDQCIANASVPLPGFLGALAQWNGPAARGAGDQQPAAHPRRGVARKRLHVRVARGRVVRAGAARLWRGRGGKGVLPRRARHHARCPP